MNCCISFSVTLDLSPAYCQTNVYIFCIVPIDNAVTLGYFFRAESSVIYCCYCGVVYVALKKRWVKSLRRCHCGRLFSTLAYATFVDLYALSTLQMTLDCVLTSNRSQIVLVTATLRRCPHGPQRGFAISNVCFSVCLLVRRIIRIEFR